MDRWVALTGDASWSFDNRFEGVYFLWSQLVLALLKSLHRSDFKKTVSFTPPRHDLRQEIPAARYDASSYGPSGELRNLYAGPGISLTSASSQDPTHQFKSRTHAWHRTLALSCKVP